MSLYNGEVEFIIIVYKKQLPSCIAAAVMATQADEEGT